MNSLVKIIILFLCCYFPNSLFAQSKRIDRLKSVVEGTSNLPDTLVLSAIDQLFEEYEYRGDTIQRNYYADLLIKEAIKRKNVSFRRQGIINKAFAQFDTNINSSKNLVDSILAEATKAQDEVIISQCYTLKGWYDFSTTKRDASCHLFKQAYDYAKDKNSPKITEALIGLAICINAQKGDPLEQPLAYLNIGLMAATRADNPVSQTRTMTKKAFMEYQAGNMETATNLAMDAVNLAEKHNYFNKDLVDNYIIIANLLYQKGEIAHTIAYATKAYDISQQLNKDFQKCRAASNLAGLLIETKGDLKFSQELLSYTLRLATEKKFPQHQAFAHLFFGNLSEQQLNLEKAKTHYIACIKIAETNNLSILSLRAQSKLSNLLVDEPGDSLNIANFLNGDTTNVEQTYFAKKFIAQLYKNKATKNQQYQKALFWSEQYNQIEKLEHQENLKNTITEKLLVQQINHQKKELTAKETLVEMTTYKNNLLSLAIILVLLILAVLYYFFYTKTKFHQKIKTSNIVLLKANKTIATLNKELSSKNKLLSIKNDLLETEIVAYISDQHQQNKEIITIKSDIEQITKEEKQTPLDWKLIYNKLDAIVARKDDWELFQQKIEKLYPDFFSILLLKHPNLNKREQTHCAYLLIGLSIKQVAESLFISKKTVESSRYRLKKKMGFSKADNLSNYLRQIVLSKEETS